MRVKWGHFFRAFFTGGFARSFMRERARGGVHSGTGSCGACVSRTSMLSRAFTTTVNPRTNGTPKRASRTFPKCGTIFTPGASWVTAWAATSAFERPTCSGRKRNCRLRFDTSIVSRSTTCAGAGKKGKTGLLWRRERPPREKKVDAHLNIAETREDEVLEQLAPYASRSDDQHARGADAAEQIRTKESSLRRMVHSHRAILKFYDAQPIMRSLHRLERGLAGRRLCSHREFFSP